MNLGITDFLKLGVCTLSLSGTVSAESEGGSTTHSEAEMKNPQPGVSERAQTPRPAKLSMTEQISGAVSDLATRAGVTEDSIKIVHARAVNWGSSAIGCPRQGMEYMQVIVPGIQLLLEANGTVYRYHGRREGPLFYCPDHRARAPAFGSGEEVM